jgi:hypothetical protein
LGASAAAGFLAGFDLAGEEAVVAAGLIQEVVEVGGLGHSVSGCPVLAGSDGAVVDVGGVFVVVGWLGVVVVVGEGGVVVAVVPVLVGCPVSDELMVVAATRGVLVGVAVPPESGADFDGVGGAVVVWAGGVLLVHGWTLRGGRTVMVVDGPGGAV